MKSRVGLALGDPAGIGPELVAKVLDDAEVRACADILVIGDARVFEAGRKAAASDVAVAVVEEAAGVAFDGRTVFLLDQPRLDGAPPEPARVSEANGRWQLDCLRLGVSLCRDHRLDALCFAPLNKDAMHRGGLKSEDESGCLAEAFGHRGPLGLLNTLGTLWTSRVTSHCAHKAVSNLITRESVGEAIRLVQGALVRAGHQRPRLAVAGLNPHAGDGGNFGTEEIETIAPAIAEAQAAGIDVQGPFPADTIFLKGRDGVFDAIVTMFHDQGQIAMKLMGFERGVTLHAGLPAPVTTSAHGSAYDIAGQGKANPEALRQAVLLAAAMAAA